MGQAQEQGGRAMICWKAVEREARDLAVYWALVMLYWLLNAFGT